MRRALLITLATVGLAACSSEEDGAGRIAALAFGQIQGKPVSVAEGQPAQAPSRLTRAAVKASGLAMIRGRLVAEDARSVLTAASDNGGYVTYLSRFGQSLTLRGSLVTASRGLGYDLLSVEAGASDPAVSPRPVPDWPAEIRRVYRFPSNEPGGRTLAVRCSFQPGPAGEIEIVEVIHRGIPVEERCTAEDGSRFTNHHFADARTGRIWRSLQWLGPDQGQIDLEIIEPHAPGR